MRVLVIGSNGFIGHNVANAYMAAGHEVHMAARGLAAGDKSYDIDLLDPRTIRGVLETAQPDAILSCAGVVVNSEAASANPAMTKNLLEAVSDVGLNPKRIVISGSAAEYGVVDRLPVPETVPLRAESPYGLSKVQETQIAQELAATKGLSVAVARIFNPIGPGMHEKFLIPSILRQVRALQVGTQDHIEVSRLDAQRDYIDVRDIGTGFVALAENDLKEVVYNIGSGKSTSNRELIELLLQCNGFTDWPKVVETSGQPEPVFANQADITRIQQELGWKPEINIEQTIREITDASR